MTSDLHMRSGAISLATARRCVPGPAGEHSAAILQRGTLDVRFAMRPGVPPQEMTVHRKDEVYVVARGRGVLLHGDARDSFEAGDLLFVAAGVKHRFADMSEDLAVWVIFYGPDGGEAAG